MPRTWGDGIIHSSHIDTLVYDSSELFNRHETHPTDAEPKIAKIIADNLIENGATLQMGTISEKFDFWY